MNPTAVPERVVVIGTSCSGKTVLSRRLAGVLDARHVELDYHHWDSNWTPRPQEAFHADVRAAVAAPRWVVDGNYSQVRPIVWPRATDVVWLDYPFRIVFGRAIARTVRRVTRRERLFRGNRESFTQVFLSKDSILLWVVATHAARRREFPAQFARPEHAHLRVHRLRSPGDADRLVEAFARSAIG